MEVFGEDVTNKEVDQMKMPSQMNLAPVLIIIKKLPFIQIRIMMIADQKRLQLMMIEMVMDVRCPQLMYHAPSNDHSTSPPGAFLNSAECMYSCSLDYDNYKTFS